MLQVGMVEKIRKSLYGKTSFPSWNSCAKVGTTSLSAVLVPLIADYSGIKVMFIVRPSFLKRHAGQIAFPGGVMEPGDRGPLVTSLRETHEEMGLASKIIEPLYLMKPESAITSGFLVYPVVGLVDIHRDKLCLDPDPNEVQDYFFLDPFNLPYEPVEKKFSHDGRIHTYMEFPLTTGKSIWGVTGRIFHSLIKDLAVLKEFS